MEVQIHWLPTFRSSPSFNRRSSRDIWVMGKSKTLNVQCKSRSFTNLDSIFDDEFKKKKNTHLTEFRFSDQFDSDINDHLPKWREEILRANMELKANSVDIPFSLRIIKKKNQWKQGVKQVSESAYCSMKKAFSSMVFIIRELQSFSIQMREKQSYENLQGIIDCVQREMHDSFVWLFTQVFSNTPTLMVSLMLLLANYSVYSMSMPSLISPPPAVEQQQQQQQQQHGRFDSSLVKTFSVSSTGGSNGGGGKFRPATARDADDDSSAAVGRNYLQRVNLMDEDLLWGSIVDEATRMKGGLEDENLRWLVAPVTAVVEEDDYVDYFVTEMMYQTGLAGDPNNSMLLANFGQFLYLVARDFDRAEVFFKKASNVTPLDAEALNKYANFLWHARNDISAAEQTYSAAVSASPTNSNYAAIYAHFLWSTGGEETCNPTDQSPQLQ
ncbi:uncharacterized protein LOC124915606 [Impatiens glandulifera]|uniref:uncharacterized protein LOC124915606 n=1 Tax=Impatiens glandulifera TaxID=253017 RepID=UPI001FB08AD3|nr:uncharacterized protein LOC124915606 [Impatiens glandulifera]